MKSVRLILIALFYFPYIGSVHQVSDMGDFNANVASGNAVIMFTTPTCSPCQVIKPRYLSLSSPQATLYLVNVDAANPESFTIAQKYSVRSYPTFLFLKNGKEVDRFVTGEDQFQQKFDTAMQNAFGDSSPVSRSPQKTSTRTPKSKRRSCSSKKRSSRRCR